MTAWPAQPHLYTNGVWSDKLLKQSHMQTLYCNPFSTTSTSVNISESRRLSVHVWIVAVDDVRVEGLFSFACKMPSLVLKRSINNRFSLPFSHKQPALSHLSQLHQLDHNNPIVQTTLLIAYWISTLSQAPVSFQNGPQTTSVGEIWSDVSGQFVVS